MKRIYWIAGGILLLAVIVYAIFSNVQRDSWTDAEMDTQLGSSSGGFEIKIVNLL